MKKVKVTFVIPKKFKRDLSNQIVFDGYGFRGKSKWIGEAIINLLAQSNYPELVNYNSNMTNFDVSETIVLDSKLKQQIDNAVLEVRKSFPAIEGVQSSIVRTAIIQRLLKSELIA